MKKTFLLGYALGLVVGEGTFTNCRHPRLAVKLHEEDPEPLLLLKSLFGGRINGPYHYKGKDGVVRRSLTWNLDGRKLMRVLPLVAKYLPASRKRQQFLLWGHKHGLVSVPNQTELMFHEQQSKKRKEKQMLPEQLRLVQ
ncbi:MAG: hypothetical protein A3E23_08210 [Burkholderiales bacterium RIFCSPHIGHO2_12_FULL_65_48]|nr:MAG: hypothetical protein A3E23_08210 [Burkholderiales bacterium RIFCSPHIGHO2_12_FULL_65_48]